MSPAYAVHQAHSQLGPTMGSRAGGAGIHDGSLPAVQTRVQLRSCYVDLPICINCLEDLFTRLEELFADEVYFKLSALGSASNFAVGLELFGYVVDDLLLIHLGDGYVSINVIRR